MQRAREGELVHADRPEPQVRADAELRPWLIPGSPHGQAMQPELHAFPPGEGPHVEVLVNGLWLVGEVRKWSRREDGSWWANVRYRPIDEPTRHVGTFPAERIRET